MQYDSTDTAIFVCSQMVQESLSFFMFLLQVKEKEETLENFEWITNYVCAQLEYKYSKMYML
jgi:hypothetical protein